MKKVGPIGVYETFIPGAKVGDLYKFYIIGYHGEELYKADPYGNEAELRPGTASRLSLIHISDQRKQAKSGFIKKISRKGLIGADFDRFGETESFRSGSG